MSRRLQRDEALEKEDRIDEMKKIIKKKPTHPAPAASIAGPCPTICKCSRTPWHLKLPSIAPPNHPRMFAASVFIAMVTFFFVYIIWLAEKKNKRKKKEPFFSNTELLSTRKHWTINPSLAQAHHRHYQHIAFISFQLKISTAFRKLSTKKIHCIQ